VTSCMACVEHNASDTHSRAEVADKRRLPQPLNRATDRLADRAKVQAHLDEHRACLPVGESGCGKSALPKEIAQSCYRHVVWIAENTLDHETASEFERAIGISHPVAEVLTALAAHQRRRDPLLAHGARTMVLRADRAWREHRSWLARILNERESLAFGLLFDIANACRAYLPRALQPLLRNWVLLDWDRQVTTAAPTG
jgi:hypothetical protein